MKVYLYKNLDKDAFNNIKTAIGYLPKSASCKISYVNFVNWQKLQKIDNFVQVVPLFDIKLK